jgi:hypothetical protein
MPVTELVTSDKPVDWAELRALHCKGLGLRELSEKYGISYDRVRAKSSREKWRHTVTKANNAVTQAVTDELADFAGRHVRKVIGLADKSMDKLLTELAKDPSLTTLEKIVGVANTLDQLGRRTAGLDKQADNKPASLTINVNTSGGQAVPLGQVIDAELVSEPGSDASNLPAQLVDAQPADEPATQPAKRKRVR